MQQFDTTFTAGKTVDFRFHDLDHMTELCPEKWDQSYKKTTEGEEYGYYKQVHSEHLQLTQIGWVAGLHIQTDCPPGAIGIASQSRGEELTKFCGRILKPVDSMFVTPNNDFDLIASPGTEYTVIAINKERFSHCANIIWGEVPDLNTWSGRFSAQSEYSQQVVQQKIISIIERTITQPDLLTDRLTAEAIENEIMEVFLLSTKLGPIPLNHAARHRAAKKAEEYIRENLGEDITVRSLCENIGISERALRKGFTEYFGVPPKTYLQNLRLHKIRSSLKAANPITSSITDIAMKFGVWHLGRLSQNYHQLYGELPRMTLQKAW